MKHTPSSILVQYTYIELGVPKLIISFKALETGFEPALQWLTATSLTKSATPEYNFYYTIKK